MNANTWFVISIIGFVVMGIAIAAAITLFFVLHIRTVIDDLSGRTVSREIKAIRENEDLSADKSYHREAHGLEKDKLSGKPFGHQTRPKTDELASTGRLKSANQKTQGITVQLRQEETTVLREEETTLLRDDTGNVVFHVTQRIMEIHTDEKIEAG